MASSHPPPSVHHSLPPTGHPHHQPQYQHHQQQGSRLPPPSYPPPPGQPGASGSQAMNGRHLPPLSQSPPYPPRHDSTLPPLSPFNQRGYPPAPNYPPPLSRQGSQHQPPPPPHYHQQQHSAAPPHYPPPPGSAHGHGHWEQPPPRHEPPPPQHAPPQHPPGGPPQRSDSSTSVNNAARRKSVISERDDANAAEPPPAAAAPREAEDGGPPASDFVKKLAKMLDDPAFAHVVCWGPKGDCFVVKDMTEFTKSILPRMFKHSNFASFVRQLNKYDFHKIKNADDTYGDQSWTFHHPDFQRSNRDALENIKRKVPAQRKSGRGSTATGPALPGSPQDVASSALANGDSTGAMSSMQAQIDQLSRSNEELVSQVSNLDRKYENVLHEMVAYQRAMAAQDSLMQNIISYFMQLESGKSSNPNDGLGKAIETYGEARMPFPQVNGLSHVPNMSYSGSTGSIDSSSTLVNGSSPELSPIERSVLARQESLQRLEELKRARERNANAQSAEINAPTPQTAPYITSLNPAAAAAAAAQQQAAAQQAAANAEFDPRTGMRVFRAGQMIPVTAEEQAADAAAAANAAAEQQQREWAFSEQQNNADGLGDSSAPEAGPSNYVNNPSAGPSLVVPNPLLDSPGGSRIRFRKATFTPAWAVPPRVLLVDDDQVSRKLFSKFLQVSGCTIDVAVDGIGAVNKMNLEKYDLVLMDIVMPKLDGVSATSLIRQFDHMTPIISMTSNSKPNDVVTYYSSGMNDILPKPFTREGLFTMLEKHLKHLKAIQQMTKGTEEASNLPNSLPDDYSSMLSMLGMAPDAMMDSFNSLGSTNIIISDNSATKRMLDSLEEERDTKRPRFEVVE